MILKRDDFSFDFEDAVKSVNAYSLSTKIDCFIMDSKVILFTLPTQAVNYANRAGMSAEELIFTAATKPRDSAASMSIFARLVLCIGRLR